MKTKAYQVTDEDRANIAQLTNEKVPVKDIATSLDIKENLLRTILYKKQKTDHTRPGYFDIDTYAASCKGMGI